MLFSSWSSRKWIITMMLQSVYNLQQKTLRSIERPLNYKSGILLASRTLDQLHALIIVVQLELCSSMILLEGKLLNISSNGCNKSNWMAISPWKYYLLAIKLIFSHKDKLLMNKGKLLLTNKNWSFCR